MGDVGETFNALKDLSREKRARNREASPEILTRKGILFESKNLGAHLIVQGRDCVIDFWPGTGKFFARGGRGGRGVYNLIKLCEVTDDC
ncbi:MAG: hypothetical protein ABUJ92_00095 [Desulfobacterales bacterium]